MKLQMLWNGKTYRQIHWNGTIIIFQQKILEISLSSKGPVRLAWWDKACFLNSEPTIDISLDGSLAKSSPLVQLRDLCLKQLPRARRGMIGGNPWIEEKHILRTFASPTWFMRTLGNTFWGLLYLQKCENPSNTFWGHFASVSWDTRTKMNAAHFGDKV